MNGLKARFVARVESSRSWATPTYVTGDVDPSVAFAVAVGLGE